MNAIPKTENYGIEASMKALVTAMDLLDCKKTTLGGILARFGHLVVDPRGRRDARRSVEMDNDDLNCRVERTS
jgi:hypothetical protein